MRFARSLGCGFVVLLALWPLASLKLHAVELGPIEQPLLSVAARQRLTALATRYVDEGRIPGLHLMPIVPKLTPAVVMTQKFLR